jgi:hypothetical protein
VSQTAVLRLAVLPLPVARVWEDRISREFSAQAAQEEKLGIPGERAIWLKLSGFVCGTVPVAAVLSVVLCSPLCTIAVCWFACWRAPLPSS